MNSAIYYVYKKKQLHRKKLDQVKNEEKVEETSNDKINTDDLITELEKLLDLSQDNKEQNDTATDSMNVEVDITSTDLAEIDNIERTLNL